MSDQEKKNAKELTDALKNLSKEQQSFVKGFAEGIKAERQNKEGK